MCGFAGYVDLRGSRKADRAVIEKMTRQLVHRGPDADGYFIEAEMGMGFRRLSIIDLVSGDQPMYSEDQSLVLMCNGEIYNNRALRAEMEAKGFRFKTKSDVEVLLYLYQTQGPAMVHRLNGQFAFVIWDRRAKKAFMARDHFGINPLHYAIVDGVLIFASEIKAILEHPLAPREVDLTGLDQLLSFPGLVSPRTMFRGISSLPPGNMLLVEDGDAKVEEYWDLDYPKMGDLPYDRPESEYVEELGGLFSNAVETRLFADVPVGYYLSGGLDSSMIAAMGNRLSPDTARATFSIRFTDEEICEAKYQRLMASDLGSEHHEALFDWSEIATSLTKMVRFAEMPVKETFNTCAMALSRAARAHGITVILAGQGADEMFAGYMGYRFDRVRDPADKGFDLDSMMEDEIREQIWGDPDLFYEKDQHAHREIKQAFYSPQACEMFPAFDCLQHPLVNKARLEGRHPLHQRSYLDFRLRLSDHLLSEHGDRMTLMSSVEGRYPFLDIDLVQFARTIPPDLKLNDYSEKYILKKIARGLIPAEIIDREKFGFRAPSSPFLLRQNIPWIQDMLSYDRIKRQGYLNADTLEQLKNRYLADDFELNAHLETDLITVALTLGIFLDEFNLPDMA